MLKDGATLVPGWREFSFVVEDGQRLLKELQQVVDGSFPKEDWMVRDMWRSSMSMMTHLLEGITILETHLEIVAPFPHEAIWHYAAQRQQDL